MVMSKIHSFCDYHLTQDEDTLHLSLLWTTSYKAKNWRTVTFILAAILDLKVKTRSNCKTDIKMNFLTPKTQETAYYTAVSAKTIEKLFFKMAYGGHFGFFPTTTYAHTFERDTPSSFIYWPSKKTKTLKNEPSLSTVTEVLQMTQLYQNYMVSHTENGGHLEKWPPFWKFAWLTFYLSLIHIWRCRRRG